MKYTIPFLFSFLLLSLVSCKSEKESNTEDKNTPDRKEMLTNIADNIITPSYVTAVSKAEALQKAIKTYTDDVTTPNLESAHQAWKEAFVAFQYIGGYDYEFLIDGLSGKKSLDEEVATFPVNTTKIEDHIGNGSTDFSKNFDRDTRGFLALDYLLFKRDGDNASINTAFASQKRKDYINAIADHIVNSIKGTQTLWTNNVASFKESKGIEAGSSTSQLFDRMVYDYETIKNYKVGIPVGRRIGQKAPEPTKVEAYYSQESSIFIYENVKAVENLWRGQANGVDGPGFDDYLKSVKGSGDEVVEKMNAQFVEIYKKLETIEGKSFSQYIVEHPEEAKEIYNELQKITKFIKSDMQSLLGIYITFDSGDGD